MAKDPSESNFIKILACPKCKSSLKKRKKRLVCSRGHKYEIECNVPIMTTLNSYLKEEAKAWEDEWKKRVLKDSLVAYKRNMRVFKRLGFWEESAEAARLIPSDKSYRVLDLGCGNGISTAHIKGEMVVGMDLSVKQMIRAKKCFPDKYFVVGDARRLPFRSNSFDLVVAINLLHHVDKPEQVLTECFRLLKKGGRLLTIDPNLYNPFGYVGRRIFRLLHLNEVFPPFPQFALGKDERQFTKSQYYKLFSSLPFKSFEIIPHRIERLLFFITILMPLLIKIPGYDSILYIVSKAGNALVKLPPFDNICYFWLGKAEK